MAHAPTRCPCCGGFATVCRHREAVSAPSPPSVSVWPARRRVPPQEMPSVHPFRRLLGAGPDCSVVNARYVRLDRKRVGLIALVRHPISSGIGHSWFGAFLDGSPVPKAGPYKQRRSAVEAVKVGARAAGIGLPRGVNHLRDTPTRR